MYRSGSSAGEQYSQWLFSRVLLWAQDWRGQGDNKRAWAGNTEHRKTKIKSGKAHQNYRLRTDGSGYALVHGRHTNVEPRTNDRNFCDYMLVTAFMSDKYLIGIRGQVQYIFYNPSGGWHCGQSNLSQVTKSFRWLSKCSFSFCLNSSLFRINLIFSFFKFCHTLGKWVRGCLSVRFNLANGTATARSSLFLRLMWKSSALLRDAGVQVSLKIDGRNPCWYCWINWSAKKSMRYSTGRIFCVLKRGSVWSLYLAPHIVRTAAFCLRIIPWRLVLAVLDHTWIP